MIGEKRKDRGDSKDKKQREEWRAEQKIEEKVENKKESSQKVVERRGETGERRKERGR